MRWIGTRALVVDWRRKAQLQQEIPPGPWLSIRGERTGDGRKRELKEKKRAWSSLLLFSSEPGRLVRLR
jgi:hypothetical protein